ncbi:unnamed protein product [Ectocarpus sp. 12 AP-2014]
MAPTLEGQAQQQHSTSSGGDVWVPGVGDSWQHNLDTPVNTDVDVGVFFINLDVAQDTIDELHGKGKYVSCYISVGTVESWRENVGVRKKRKSPTFFDTGQDPLRPRSPQREVKEGRGLLCAVRCSGSRADAMSPDRRNAACLPWLLPYSTCLLPPRFERTECGWESRTALSSRRGPELVLRLRHRGVSRGVRVRRVHGAVPAEGQARLQRRVQQGLRPVS